MGDIVDIFSKGKTGASGGGPPPVLPGPALKQTDYRIRVVDKVTLKEIVYDKRGHIVITANNIVLFDEHQEMTWGIPNDEAVISFERIGDGNPSGESLEEIVLVPEDSAEYFEYDNDDDDPEGEAA